MNGFSLILLFFLALFFFCRKPSKIKGSGNQI